MEPFSMVIFWFSCADHLPVQIPEVLQKPDSSAVVLDILLQI